MEEMGIRVNSMLAGVAMLVTVLVAALTPQLASADTPPDAGKAFVPQPQSEPGPGVSEPPSQPLNAVTGTVGTAAGPDPDPRDQIHDVIAKDGAHIYTETYLPDPWNGEPLPSILIFTPYEAVIEHAIGAAFGISQSAYGAKLARYWAARGYAVTIAHARGTGKSDGCNDYYGETERDDISRVIQYLGGEVEGDPPPAAWASGSVGMYGLSYIGTTQIAAATLGAKEHPERMKFLKTIVPLAGVTSAYAFGNSDGVPYAGVGYPANTAAMLGWGTTDSGRPTDRAGCQASEHAAGTALSGVTGDFTTWFAERELRSEARNVDVPVLMTSNFFDSNVQPSHPVGFFNYLPPELPHMIVLPADDHGAPEFKHPEGWEREEQDWRDTVTAWYDRWLKGFDTGVEDWPTAQVQEATTGQWHSEDSWPPVNAPEGKLALGPAPDSGQAGLLGDTRPAGSTTYSEVSVHPNPGDAEDRGSGDTAIWWSEPLDEPLHLTGEPRLDLWVTLDQPDAHIIANLQAFGAPTPDAPGGEPLLPLVADGRRSARHLEPLVDERFQQSEGRPAPTGGPLMVPIRFWPVDVVVPEGGRLRLSLAGVTQALYGANPTGANPGIFSEAATDVEVLHDCAHPSVLRFHTPSPGSKLLNVREPDEKDLDPLPSNPPYPTPRDTGGGIGKRPICR